MTNRCSCGTRVGSLAAMATHRKGWWHKNAHRVRRLRKLGLSYSEVARQVGRQRQWVWLVLRREGL